MEGKTQNQKNYPEKIKISLENNPCINEGEDYYPELVPSFTILYATEMGTAESFATDLYEEATQKLHLKANLFNVEKINDIKIFNESALIVIIASTFGEGEPTNDCVEFNKMLQSKEFWDRFNNQENLNVAIFGLGNDFYTYFNAQAKLFYKILVEEKKINSICDLGLGNAKEDIFQDFTDWKDKKFFKNLYHFFSQNYEKNYEFYKKNNLLNIIETKDEKTGNIKNYEIFCSENKQMLNLSLNNYNKNVQNCLISNKIKILNIEEKRPNNVNGSTLKVTFDLSGTGIKYKPADSVLIYPKNKKEIVDIVINHLEQGKENDYINYKLIEQNKDKELFNLSLPEGITVKEALNEFIDLSCHINKNILSKLINYLSDINEKNKANEIINDEKKLSEFLSKNYNIAEFIKEFNSLKLTMQRLCEIFPIISPRYYTCCSSYKKNNNIIEIIITLVTFKGPLGEIKYGMTSNYFDELFKSKSFQKNDEYARISLKDTEFKFPFHLQTPMLMIGTGSGIAPFISFLQEFESIKNNNAEMNFETYLIFGSMNKKNDFIFENELNEFKQKGVLKEYFTAFSRDQDKKFYVQDALMKNFDKEKIENLIIKRIMHVYVCGSVRMGNSVKEKLKELLGDENYEKMIKNKQLYLETWEN